MPTQVPVVAPAVRAFVVAGLVRARHKLVYEVKKDVVGYFHPSWQFGQDPICLFCSLDGLQLATICFTICLCISPDLDGLLPGHQK
jgi:hypothetical protein